MLKELSKIFKQFGILAAIIGGLTIFGNFINNLVIWEWLVNIFTIFRKTILIIDAWYDTDTTFIIIEWGFKILLAYWAYLGIVAVAKHFKK